MELIKIGEITKHQGNKGEVRVKPFTDFPERFEEMEKLKLTKGRLEKEVVIEKVRYHKGYVILKFVDVDDIGAAMEYKGFEILIPKADRFELAADAFYIEEILGLQVYQEDELLGEIESIIETGSNDVYVIKQNGQSLLIPALKDVVLEVDLEKRKMAVNLPKGLR
ncbi:MAG: ribosome maturation factor RimM [Bacillota bacterium]